MSIDILPPRCGSLVRPSSSLAWLLVSAIISICVLPVQGMSQSPSPEEKLRQRISEYWDAMQTPDYEKAVEYIQPESRKTFARVPRSRILKWKLKNLDCNQEVTTCDAVIIANRPLPGIGSDFGFELHNQWVLQDGEWYFRIPWGENDNPMLNVFKQQAALAQSAPIQDAVAAPRTKADPETHARLAESAQRLAPDPGNPAIVQFGEKAIFRFTYSNSGKLPIRILSAHSDCHCTSPQQEHSEVLPGQTGIFQVVLDTFGLPLGPIDKDVYVQFDDLEEPLVIPIHAINRPNFAIMPASVDFGLLDNGRPAEKSVRLLNQSGRSVRILSQLKSDPGLEVRVEKAILAANEEVVITLRYNPLKNGEFLDNLMIETDLPAQSLLNIWVKGRVGK